MNKTKIIYGLLIIVIAGGSFFGGMKYQQSQRSSFPRQFGAGQTGNGTNGSIQNRSRGGGMVMGEIINQDDKSITVKLQDNSSKIVLLSQTTTINKALEGTISDLKVGERVAVFGSNNSDGTVTAQNVQMNPQSMMNQRNPQ